MRPSFYMRKYWVKPGKKRPLCIRVHRKVPSWARSSCNAFLSGKSWQYFVAVHSRRALQGGERHHKYGAAFGGVERGYRAIETLYNFLHNG